MNEKTIGYAAVITVEIPNTPTPFEVSVMLYPADAIDTAGKESSSGAFKVLRECTLADLMAFADRLEVEVLEEFAATALSTFARPGHGSVKVKLPQEIGRDIADRDHWWRTTRVALIEGLQESSDADEPEPTIILIDQVDDHPVAIDDLTVKELEEKHKEHQEEPESEVDPLAAGEGVVEPAIGQDDIDAEEGLDQAAESAVTTEAIQEEPADQIEATVAPEVTAQLDFSDLIVVSNPEQVFEEREAPDGDAARAVHVIERKDTENRLAGTRLPLDDPTAAAVDILFDEHPFRQAQAHASSSLSREVAGMLVGPQPEKQPNGRYVVHVTDVIVAKHTRMQGASVTYTPESWRYINDVLRERYPDEECVIVGWYHTHPGFGIFLSNMDLFIHHNFFTQKWHIALVLDPVGRRSGFFTWDRPQSEVMAYHFPWPYWAHSSW